MIINKKPNIMKNGFVKFYRDYENHRWFSDPNTVAVLVRCLLNANLSESYFEGQIIPKGSFATSIASLSAQTGVKQNAIRTALNRLTTDKVITIKATNRFTIVSICGFDDCDASETNNPQTTNKQSTSNPQTNVQAVGKQHIQKLTTEKEKELEKEVEKEKKEEQEVKSEQQSLDFNINNSFITSTIVDVPSENASAGKKKNISVIKEKKEKKYTIIHRCRLAFEQHYLQKKGEQYYYEAKDANAIKHIIDKIKSKLPEEDKNNEDAIAFNFDAFIQAILNSGRVEKWIIDNFSLPVINSKFNEIYSQLKNGRQQHQNARDDEQSFFDELERRYGNGSAQ